MKFALFLILFVGLVCVAQARSNFLDTLFVSQSSQVEMAMTCNATDSCAGKGDACKGIYGIPGCSPTNGTCCSQGLFCVNSLCVTDNVGQNCTSQTQCVSSSPTPMNCVAGSCVYIYGPGDSCSNNTDCASNNCTSGVCYGGSMGQSCSTASSLPSCNFGLYCTVNMNASTTCQNRTAEGGNCTTTMQCMEGTTCFSSTQNANGTLSQAMCQAIGTQDEGGPCMDSSACDSGNVCYQGNCTTVGTSMTACNSNANCTGGLCACSSVTGDMYCVGSLYNNPCTDESISLETCLATSMCSEATDAPNSCCYANCLSQYKKSVSCGCSFADSVSGDCVYNQYCGGFPVWAIIVIIVVAIVLVLAIVLLVFFMMRRRRQYDSI